MAFINRIKVIDFSKISDLFLIVFRAILVSGIAFIILYPVLINFSISLMSVEDMVSVTTVWIPSSINYENYIEAWNVLDYPVAFLESIVLSLVASISQLISCTFVGYGFARFEFKGKKLFFMLVILTLIIPPQLIMIPLFLNFRFFDLYGLLQSPGLNLLGTYWPFILTSITAVGLRNGLFIYIMRQFFKGMPQGLEEAAYVDGAGPITTFFRVMLPGAVSAMIVVFLFSFVWQWNDTFYNTLYQMERGGLAMSLNKLVSRLQYLATEATGMEAMLETEYTSIILNTSLLLFILPLLVIFISLQRYFVESVERTGFGG